MQDIATSFGNSNSLHENSTLINSTGSVGCWDCHPEHEIRPDDGGLSVPGCGATNLNVSCHVPDEGWGNRTDTPSSHGSNWVVAGRDNCIESGCHDKHNYTLDPTEGHDPKAPSCHGTGGDGGCEPNTNSHPIHIDSTNDPSYDFDCGECHWDTVSDPSEADGTFGTVMHNNGTVDVNFDNTTNGVSTYRGNLSGGSTPTYEGGNGSCSGTYCHSNGFGVGGVDFRSYETPDWSGGDVYCGDCHGIPNYYNGTAWREMGGNTTNNSANHLKHTRNYGGINASRYLFWVDNTGNATDTTPPFGWRDSDYDAGEAIIQDLNNNRMLDYGILNGNNDQGASPSESPDNVYVTGSADIRDFATADAVWYDDTNTDGNWDRNEDIYKETGGGGNKDGEYDDGKDAILYIGGDGQQLVDGNPYIELDSADDVMYLDSDHDDVYDAWYDDVTGGYGMKFSGWDEPLIYTVGKSTGADLEDTDEVLQGAGPLIYWNVDFNGWYSFDCSECHYNNPPTQGWGTYNTSKHVNADRDITFDTTSNGIASKNGTYSANASAPSAWSPSTQECYGIWCHSDGYTRDATNGSADGNGAPDWSGTGIQDDQYDNFIVRPKWTDTNRTTVYCGSCHYSWDKPTDASNGIDRPNTGGHRKNAHNGQSQFGWHGGSDATPCLECHWRYDTFDTSNENQWWRPYGSSAHVDGGTWVGPDTGFGPGNGLFGVLSESQSYGDTTSDKCHNTWPSAWRSGYSANGC
jgi:predicted CxxxxCH...CXXCH cytochrome family protein